jgi:signal transduction histidine kinase
MSDIPISISDTKYKTHIDIQSRLALGLTLFVQTFSIIIIALVAINAAIWFQTPFIGALVGMGLEINAIEPAQEGTWNGLDVGLAPKDRLVSVNGVDIYDHAQLFGLLRSFEISDEVELSVQSLNGSNRDVNVVLQQFPTWDRVALFGLPYLVGIVFLGCGLWVLSLRRLNSKGRVFPIFTASAAISVAGFFEIISTNDLTLLWILGTSIAAGTLIHFALVYPEEVNWSKRLPFLKWIGYLVSIAIGLMGLLSLFDGERLLGRIQPWRLFFIYLGISIILFVFITITRRIRSISPVYRRQATTILWGSFFAFIPFAIWLFINAFNQGRIPFSPFLFFPLVIFPISISYVILRFEIINTDYVLSRVLLYVLLSILAVVGYALIVSGLGIILGDVLFTNNPYLLGLLFFILALLVNPIRQRIQVIVDRIFFRRSQYFQENTQKFGNELNPTMGLSEIANLLWGYIESSLEPESMYVFILDPLRDIYIATPGKDGKPSTDIQFLLNSPLPQLLSLDNSCVYIRSDQEFIPALIPEKSRIALLATPLFVPIPGRGDQVIGFMALGPRRSGELYKGQELDYIRLMCSQAAMAFERAQVVEALERRVNEMDALIRVSQGINITLGFDDILELIYAQATRIIPSRDFWILLYDRENQLYYYAFYLENDQRLVSRENQALSSDSDLAQEVIRTSQPILTENYVQESQTCGIKSQVEGIYAWVGVPLNAGAETIGAMSFGSRDPSVIYSLDQIELLQAIADQVAGAIVKARLLEESERSAVQLQLLNEVARNLTSTLDVSNLLDQILENAIDIIGCEAGTLFLVDEDTGELVFEVVKGPVADELQSQRLPPGTGHAGKAVETGKSAIVNEARHTIEWARSPDQKTGFYTRDLLLAPLFTQDRVVGVIEVINRLDRLPFTKDDQDLLTAFSSQAAIALENARLYTLTDQRLAERVDELSVMQRIDRELNTSLEVSRAMRITLDWAIRQSGADAGLVGTVSEGDLRVMAEHGYSDELESYKDSTLPVELPGLKSAVDDETTQQIRRSEFLEQRVGEFTLLKGAESQIVIPIRREEQVIGLILLESHRVDPWTEEVKEFLSRLSDHAAIAIANAQLFLQVQEADLAKTEFVSFVSHELKTPMTSIRGYTDLLLGGAVGGINEAQENFLRTVRSNVNRMATLVSDLADISRIESGRLRLEFAPVGLMDVVDEVVQAQEQRLKEKGQTLEQRISENLPPVWGDRNRILQVLTNLLSNANKYTPDGGIITIQAKQSDNLWDSEGAPVVVLIDVQDTGIGMLEEDKDQIFTKFFRSADPKVREVPGTGLGLNITKYLVEMQGGRIWFESEFGKGTTFRFTLPIAEV